MPTAASRRQVRDVTNPRPASNRGRHVCASRCWPSSRTRGGSSAWRPCSPSSPPSSSSVAPAVSTVDGVRPSSGQAAHLSKENDQALARAARRGRRHQGPRRAGRGHAERAPGGRGGGRGERWRNGRQGPRERRAHRCAITPTDVMSTRTGLFSQVFFDASLMKRSRPPAGPAAALGGCRPEGVGPPRLPTRAGQRRTRRQGDATSVFRKADTVARSEDGLYLILLEDTPENGAIWTSNASVGASPRSCRATRSGWVSNPAYGFDADQAGQARAALEVASGSRIASRSPPPPRLTWARPRPPPTRPTAAGQRGRVPGSWERGCGAADREARTARPGGRAPHRGGVDGTRGRVGDLRRRPHPPRHHGRRRVLAGVRSDGPQRVHDLP